MQELSDHIFKTKCKDVRKCKQTTSEDRKLNNSLFVNLNLTLNSLTRMLLKSILICGYPPPISITPLHQPHFLRVLTSHDCAE